jgi:DNA (cytosine-5)-methyltransferase 1
LGDAQNNLKNSFCDHYPQNHNSLIPGKQKNKIKILNLFCGIGGNRHLWNNPNYEITAVDLDINALNYYRHLYPDDSIIQHDALDYLLKNYQFYDVIWASPPCPTHSKARCYQPHFIEMNLYQIIYFCQQYYQGTWLIENVRPYYEPFIKPTLIMGRHAFWSNKNLTLIPKFNDKKPDKFDHMTSKQFPEYLGFTINHIKGNGNKTKFYRNCVHPELGKLILDNLLRPNPTLFQYHGVE